MEGQEEVKTGNHRFEDVHEEKMKMPHPVKFVLTENGCPDVDDLREVSLYRGGEVLPVKRHGPLISLVLKFRQPLSGDDLEWRTGSLSVRLKTCMVHGLSL